MIDQKTLPQEAYLYFPTESEKFKDSTSRWFFDGPITFTSFELQKLSDFKKYCIKHKYQLDVIWNENLLNRFLHATGFKNDKCLKCVKEYTVWRKTKIPQPLTTEVEKFITNGTIYVHGRDHRFRPIVVFNAHMIQPKKTPVEVGIESFTYLFEHIVHNLMLPGQVENWVFIVDLKGMGLTSLPLGALKKMLGFLSHSYRGRLKTLYILNTPTSIWIPWNIAKGFLEENTIKKIQFIKKGVPEPIFQHAHPDQIEKKFGGNAPDATHYWPPIFPSNNYFLPSDNPKTILETKSEYYHKYKSGQFKKYYVNQDIIHEMQELERKEQQKKAQEIARIEMEELHKSGFTDAQCNWHHLMCEEKEIYYDLRQFRSSFFDCPKGMKDERDRFSLIPGQSETTKLPYDSEIEFGKEEYVEND